MQVNETAIGSFACSVTLAPYLRVKYDVTNGLAVAGATEKELGTLKHRHIVSGLGASTHAAVVLANAPGTVKMVAANAITAWATVYGAASGMIDDVPNNNPIGIALETATATGDYIEVLRLPNLMESQQSDLEVYPIPVSDLRVHDAPSTVLPATPANDDLGVVDNTFGTAAPTVETGDLKAAGATTRYARFMVPVPVEYTDAQTITLRINAGMKTTIADTTATLDVECVRQAAPDTDICATAAVSINSLTAADKDFTITPTNVVGGDVLDVRVAVAVNDGATGTAVIGKINSIELLLDVNE